MTVSGGIQWGRLSVVFLFQLVFQIHPMKCAYGSKSSTLVGGAKEKCLRGLLWSLGHLAWTGSGHGALMGSCATSGEPLGVHHEKWHGHVSRVVFTLRHVNVSVVTCLCASAPRWAADPYRKCVTARVRSPSVSWAQVTPDGSRPRYFTSANSSNYLQCGNINTGAGLRTYSLIKHSKNAVS